MTHRVIGFEPLVLPARGFRAGMGLHGSAPHSRGAKRRENVRRQRRSEGRPLHAVVTPLLIQAMTRCARGQTCLSRLPSRATRGRVSPRQEEIVAR